MTFKDRMKASDVHRETDYVFVKKTTFEKAYPMIKSVKVEYTEIGYQGQYQGVKRTVTEKNLGEFIDCTNSLCYNGGFSIGEILRHMVMDNQKHWEGSRMCQGYEGSPKGKRKYRNCLNAWNIVVDIEYKEEKTEK